MSARAKRSLLAGIVALTAATSALAQAAPTSADAGTSNANSTPSAGGSVGPSDAGAAGVAAGACVEHVPAGAERPILGDRFPPRGLSGYAATLEVKVFHGKGESVLPNGLAIRAESEAGIALKKAGFVLPHQDGGARARIEAQPEDPAHPGLSVTLLSLPVLLLPEEPGRNTLTLPPLPVAVARKNGDLATVCTHAHVITVEDPTANTPDPSPQPNPKPLPQREEWTALRDALQYVGMGVLAGIALLLLVRWWRARPKPVPPPPPPRPAWEIALEKLAKIRADGLLEQDRLGEHFDRVSDAVRAYLGERYGFDGLESTTDEILASLKKRAVSVTAFSEVTSFLGECDLVKFANAQPTDVQCEKILEFGIAIVRSTTPQGTAPRTRAVPASAANAAGATRGTSSATPADTRNDPPEPAEPSATDEPGGTSDDTDITQGDSQ